LLRPKAIGRIRVRGQVRSQFPESDFGHRLRLGVLILAGNALAVAADGSLANWITAFLSL
jgi:hypothetical protein